MDNVAQRGAKQMRKLRSDFDDLLTENGGKRPTNYAKLRKFTDQLVSIVDGRTRSAGCQARVKLVVVDNKPKTDPDGLMGSGGPRIAPVMKRNPKSKDQLAREKRHEDKPQVFVPKKKAEPKDVGESEADRIAREEAEGEAAEIAKRASEQTDKGGRGIEGLDDGEGGKKDKKGAPTVTKRKQAKATN